MVTDAHVNEFVGIIQEKVSQTGDSLGLLYPQVLEVKYVY